LVYCHKDKDFDSLRRKVVKLEESNQRIKQDRVELRARDIDQMKQTDKAFSFRKAILRQDRRDDQERFAQAREQLVQARESVKRLLAQHLKSLSDVNLRDSIITLNSSRLSFKNDLLQMSGVC
jgi:hypothetical protein